MQHLCLNALPCIEMILESGALDCDAELWGAASSVLASLDERESLARALETEAVLAILRVRRSSREGGLWRRVGEWSYRRWLEPRDKAALILGIDRLCAAIREHEERGLAMEVGDCADAVAQSAWDPWVRHEPFRRYVFEVEHELAFRERVRVARVAAAVQLYATRRKRAPPSVEALVRHGFLTAVPAAPSGTPVRVSIVRPTEGDQLVRVEGDHRALTVRVRAENR